MTCHREQTAFGPRRGRGRAAAIVLAAAVLSACVNGTDGGVDRPAEVAVSPTTALVGAPAGRVAAPPGERWRGTTPPSGNRLHTAGQADLGPEPLAVSFERDPVWVVGAPAADGGTVWAIVTVDGVVHGRHLLDGVVTAVDLGVVEHDPAGPPVLVVRDGAWELLRPPAGASPLTSPVVLGDGRVAHVDDDGTLRVDGSVVLDDVLPDSRITQTADGRLAVLRRPTDVYGHGVLGDGIEAAEVAVLTPDGATVEGWAPAPHADAPDVQPVIEGTSVIAVDVDGAPGEELLRTVSDDRRGAAVDALGPAGIFTSDGIGRGGRWRHVIGAFAGEDGTPRIAEVVTPHLRRTVQFLRRDRGLLVASSHADDVISSHRLGSRNLDEAALVRLTSGGRVPALVGPAPDHRGLVAATERGGAVVVLHRLDLPAAWVTNLGVTERLDGAADLAVGLGDGTVLFWSP